jgi:hypothetical protein
MGLILGVVVLEAILALVGYAFVAPFVAGRRRSTQLSYLGVAVVAGNGAVSAAASALAVTGVRLGLWVVLGAAAATAAVGLTLAWTLAPTGYPREDRRPRASRLEEIAALVAGTGLVGLCVGMLWGGFRSTPWLDDSWFFWLPKGLVLDKLGLDARLFVPGHTYETLTSPDYPLGWSVLLDSGVRVVGKVDLRVVNAELTVVAVGYLGAVVRLLWSLVRPVFALTAAALIAVAPEFEHQVLGGGADIVVAVYVTLFALAACSWLVRGNRLDVLLAGVFAAGALATKTEGPPELLAVLIVIVLFGWRARRRFLPLLLACAAAVATAAPWFVWRQHHGVQNSVSFTHGLDPSYLSDRFSRVAPTWRYLRTHMFDIRSWTLILPIAIALTALVLLLDRRPLALAPLVLVAANVAILVWVYWADPLDLNYRLATSGYRTIDTVMLLGALASGLLADRALAALRERFVRRRPGYS